MTFSINIRPKTIDHAPDLFDLIHDDTEMSVAHFFGADLALAVKECLAPWPHFDGEIPEDKYAEFYSVLSRLDCKLVAKSNRTYYWVASENEDEVKKTLSQLLKTYDLNAIYRLH